jgi:hypoxanthine phosphoribosyltransferase
MQEFKTSMNNLMSFFIGIISSIVAAFLFRWVLELLDLRFPFRRIMFDITTLYHRIDEDKYVPDLIVSIDRNGTIVGAILAGYFGYETVVSIATINGREKDGSRSIVISEAHLPKPDSIIGKRLLIIICFNDSGSSLEAVYQRLSMPLFSPAEIRMAALYTSVSPKLKPKYFAREVGRDLKTSINNIIYRMPWMVPGWRHVLASERLTIAKRKERKI